MESMAQSLMARCCRKAKMAAASKFLSSLPYGGATVLLKANKYPIISYTSFLMLILLPSMFLAGVLKRRLLTPQGWCHG